MVSLALTILLAELRFQGVWECPDRAAVEQQLAALGAVVQGRHVVELVGDKASTELRLIDTSGAVLARRALPADPHCDRRAHVVAVLIASWESEMASRPPEVPPDRAPGATSGPPSSSLSSAPATAIPTVGTPPPSPPAAAPIPPPAETSPAAKTPAPAPEVSSSALDWRLGLAPIVAVAEGEAAIGGLLFVSLQPEESRWGAQLKAFLTTTRSFTLGPGSVSWQRFAVSVGGSFDLSRAPLVVQLQADAALALLRTQAHGFDVNHAPSALDPGISAGLLAAWRGHTFEPWLGAWVLVWPLAQQAQVVGSSSTRTIPQVDLMAGLGVALLIP